MTWSAWRARAFRGGVTLENWIAFTNEFRQAVDSSRQRWWMKGTGGDLPLLTEGVRMTSGKATEETVRRLFKAYLGHGMNRDKAVVLIAGSLGMEPADVKEIIQRDINAAI